MVVGRYHWSITWLVAAGDPDAWCLNCKKALMRRLLVDARCARCSPSLMRSPGSTPSKTCCSSLWPPPTDAWCSNSNQAFLSLTAHYIDEEYALWMLPLECSPFDGSHTGQRTLEKTNAMLSSNSISEEYTSSLVADNAGIKHGLATLL